jgi:hypothetical protein
MAASTLTKRALSSSLVQHTSQPWRSISSSLTLLPTSKADVKAAGRAGCKVSAKQGPAVGESYVCKYGS